MPSGREFNTGRRGSGTTKKNAFCSFCRKSYRDVGPLVEGPGDVYICGECIDLCQSILEQERRRRGTSKPLFNRILTPRQIVDHLDQYVIGQDRAKRVLAVAVHSHYKRLMHGGGRVGDRDRQVEHPHDRADRLRQDPLGADACPAARRPLRHRRRDDVDRGRLRRRGRGEPAAEAPSRRRLRPRSRPAGHPLHRRDRQDRQDQPERLHHPRRFRRRRAAGAAEDARRDGRQRAARKAAASIPSSNTSRWTPRTSCSSAAAPSSASRTSSASGWASGPSASARTSGGHDELELGELLQRVTSDDILQFGMIPELVGRLPVVSALQPLDDGRPGPRPHRAEERPGEAVSGAVHHGERRAELHRRRLAGDRPQGPREGHRRPRPRGRSSKR